MTSISEKKYCPAEIREVQLTDTFWDKYASLVRETVLPYQWRILNDQEPDAVKSHAMRNFRIAAGLEDGDFYGEVFQDSDLAKWIEAASYVLEAHDDKELENLIEEAVDIIEAAQQENGYLDTCFTIRRQDQEWKNLYECHEMYCMGHMMEASAAYYKATGKRRFLDIMCRCADHISSCFGAEDGKRRGYPGHQEIELALVKLYQVTGRKEYLDLSRFFLRERGKTPNYFITEWEKSREKREFKTGSLAGKPDLYYNQSHCPVTEQETAVGHAVRAMYMYAAMADVARETGDGEMIRACRRLWEDVTQRQMYITGAVGSTYHGEAFTFDYDLPNETAYAETCASVGLILFAGRMQQIDMDSRYSDVIERVLYNTILASMSEDGKHYFYVNPQEMWPEASKKNPDRRHVITERREWFGCACCPPNIARLLTSLQKYVCSTDGETMYIHLYISGNIRLEGRRGEYCAEMFHLRPWSKETEIQIKSTPGNRGSIALRVPEWCEEWAVYVNNKEKRPKIEKGYLYLDNILPGDMIRFEADMPVRLMQADPRVRADAGKAAIQMGPFVYCLEEKDNGANLSALRIDIKSIPKKVTENGQPDKIPSVVLRGWRTEEWCGGRNLYQPYSRREQEILLTAVPYFTWGNRTPGEMLIWIRT